MRNNHNNRNNRNTPFPLVDIDLALALDRLPLVGDLHLAQYPHQLVVVDEADDEIVLIHHHHQDDVVVPLTMIIVREVPREVALHRRYVDEIVPLFVSEVRYERLLLRSQMRRIINLDL